MIPLTRRFPFGFFTKFPLIDFRYFWIWSKLRRSMTEDFLNQCNSLLNPSFCLFEVSQLELRWNFFFSGGDWGGAFADMNVKKLCSPQMTIGKDRFRNLLGKQFPFYHPSKGVQGMHSRIVVNWSLFWLRKILGFEQFKRISRVNLKMPIDELPQIRKISKEQCRRMNYWQKSNGSKISKWI